MIRFLLLGLVALTAGCSIVQMAQLDGTVTYRERIALPPQTELRVALEDVTDDATVGRLVAEQVIHPNRQVPIPFSLSYDRRAIEAHHRYRLIAEIRDEGNQLLWRTKDAEDPFKTNGAVELLVKRIGGPSQSLPTWHYRCDDADFTFAPGNDDNARLYFDNRHYEVKHVPSASGARYEGGGVMFWSKGGNGVLNVGGKTFAGCTGEPQYTAPLEDDE